MLLLATGCQGGNGPAPAGPMAPQSCERICNAQYDGCMDRTAGPASNTGDVCPDQLRTCLKRCPL